MGDLGLSSSGSKYSVFDETNKWKWRPRVGFGNLSSDQPTVQGQCDWLGMGRSAIQHKPGVSQAYNCAMFTDIYISVHGDSRPN